MFFIIILLSFFNFINLALSPEQNKYQQGRLYKNKNKIGIKTQQTNGKAFSLQQAIHKNFERAILGN